MKKKLKALFSHLIILTILLSGCTFQSGNLENQNKKINIVATTTMLADLTTIIGGDRVNVNGLMGAGIDPHLYQASAGDVSLMQKADVVVYNGLHLEGKMGEVFKNLSINGKTIICIENGLDKLKLLEWQKDSSVHDPHIWFDVSLWKQAAIYVSDELSCVDINGKEIYKENLESYLKKLDELDTYIFTRVSELPKSQRVLITAHDAFKYFGKAYGFEVQGLQGISTDAEASTNDMSNLANFIVDRKIKAIFVESSVPPKTIQALKAAVKAKNFNVKIGGELYSDSLGDEKSKANTYVLTVKSNIDTIVDALK